MKVQITNKHSHVKMDNGQEKAAILYQDLETWMTNLPPKLRTVPIIHLAIPGSHDSMTASITSSSKLAPDAEEILIRLKFLGPLLRLIMSRWSKTQGCGVLEQLNSGIRYFDLRVATMKNQVYPYFVHGLYANEVVPMLNDVKAFIDAHPMEVVILDFQHFYAFEKTDHDNFLRLLNATFQNRLMPYTQHMEHITLEYMTMKFTYQVLIIYRSDSARFGQPYMWPGYNFPTPWPQTISETELIAKLDEGIANRSQSLGYVSQCVLTPTNWFVTKHLFSTLKAKCAKPLQKLKLEWLRRQKVGIGGVNIVICDFTDMSDNQFVKEVIVLNVKMLESQFNASSLTPVDK